MNDIYKPREDSLLLAEHARRLAYGKVLDIGTGSGIQAVEVANLPSVKSVLAVDINPKAIKEFNKLIKRDKLVKVKTRVSDLFSKIKKSEVFNTIIFNPPYLPDDKKKDVALHGGKKGYEVIGEFLKKVKKHLATKGIILLLFSSLSKRTVILKLIKEQKLKPVKIGQQKIFFEDLYVYKISR